jgi:hypothetical protein
MDDLLVQRPSERRRRAECFAVARPTRLAVAGLKPSSCQKGVARVGVAAEIGIGIAHLDRRHRYLPCSSGFVRASIAHT